MTVRQRPKYVDGAAWRGHECRDCGHRFVTIQRVATPEDLDEANVA